MPKPRPQTEPDLRQHPVPNLPGLRNHLKDGGSRDGSIDTMRRDPRICIYQEPDHSIYEAMNQAVSHVTDNTTR